MTKRISLAFVLTALATAVMIFAVAAIPAFLFAKEDETLYQNLLERHREQGALAPEGQDNYLVRTLYIRAEQLQNGYGYTPETPELDTLRRQITPALNEMAKTGILPAGLSAELGIIVERDNSLSGYYADSAGFVQAVFSGESGSTVRSFGLELEPRTGLITSIWVNTAGDATEQTAGYDYDFALEAYKTWLGLDALDDWQSEETGFSTFRQTSRKGLIQLYLLGEDRLLHLGITTLSSGSSSQP